LGAKAMRLRAAYSTDTATVREVPRAEVCILWVNDFYDVPLQGMAEVSGDRCLFEIIDRDSLGTENETYRYWLIALTPEQRREEEGWHDLFCRKVGTHFDYTGRPALSVDKVCPDEFYGPYSHQMRPDYAGNEIVGWLRL
jgi:hypothetical protein